jgi:hypothetical protein
VAAEKKRLEDELAEEKRKTVEATAQFNFMATGRSIFCVDDPFEEEVTNYCTLQTIVTVRRSWRMLWPPPGARFGTWR